MMQIEPMHAQCCNLVASSCQAAPTVLEPVMLVEVTVPGESQVSQWFYFGLNLIVRQLNFNFWKIIALLKHSSYSFYQPGHSTSSFIIGLDGISSFLL